MSAEDPNTLYPNHDNLAFRSYQHIHVSESTDSKGLFPILGYNSDIGYIKFFAGEETDFHYPISGEDVNWFNIDDLNKSGLVLDGAFFGDTPSRADRIFVKNDNYHFESVNGDYITDEEDWVKNGTWLCAWLSGSYLDDNPPKWMDRWYDPSRVDHTGAINAVSDSPYVYDTPSKIKLSPGLYCSYRRIGDKDIEEINSRINQNSVLRFGIDDWTKVLDNDRFLVSNITTENFRNPKIGDFSIYVNESCSFNGVDQYVYRKYDEDEMLVSGDEFAVSTWIKTDDFLNRPIGSFIGCGYRSGWECGVENYATTRLIVFAEDAAAENYNGRVYIKNSDDELISHKDFGDKVRIYSTIIDAEDNIWLGVVIDNKVRLLKCDISLTVFENIEVCSKPTNFAGIDMWNSPKLYDRMYVRVTTNSADDFYTIDIVNNEKLSSRPSVDKVYDGSYLLYIEIDGGYYVVNGKRCFLWSRPDENGSGIVAQVDSGLIPADDMNLVLDTTCDWNNVYWALIRRRDNDTDIPEGKSAIVSYKFDQEKKVYVRDRIVLINEVSTDSFIRMSCRIVNGLIRDCFYVIDDARHIYYLIDEKTGVEIKEFRLTDYNGFYKVVRTITNYERLRTSCIKDRLYFKLYTYTLVNNDPDHKKRYVELVKYDDSKTMLGDNRYHHVCVVKDDAGVGIVLDCKRVANLDPVSRGKIYYLNVGGGISIGVKCGYASNFNEEHNINNVFSRVILDDIRLFEKALSGDDIRYVYLSRFHLLDFCWYFNSYNRYLLEEIEHFNRFKMPGSKSAHFEIHLKGYTNDGDKPVDESVKKEIEQAIMGAINMLTPAYTDIFRIVWDGKVGGEE